MSEKSRRRLSKPNPREVLIKPATYQPSRAELREEHDMPGWSRKRMRKSLLGPIKLVSDDRKRP